MSDVAMRLRRQETIAGGARATSHTAARSSRTERGFAPSYGFLIALGVWLLTHSYPGVHLDSRIYIGRAIADLSPHTVGQDLMFVHDGQSPFSLYTPLVRQLVQMLGPDAAAALLALAGATSWFAGAAALTGRLASGRLRWAMLVCAAVLPAEYGGFSIIPFGEALAVPRPLAEGAVLGALAAMLGGRRLLAVGLLLVGALFHPIMALAGFGTVFLLLAMQDRRWLILPPVGGVLAMIGLAVHAPILGRLVQTPDPAWLELLRWRNPYLFPGLWPLSTWSQTAVQLATVGLAAALSEGRVRGLLLAAAGVALAGLAAAFLLGDVYPSLLALQVQPWRALWLTAALAALALPVAAVRLRAQSPCARVALAMLAAAWIAPQSPAALLLAGGAAAVYALSRSSAGRRVAEPAARFAWILTAVLALGWVTAVVLTTAGVAGGMPLTLENADGALLMLGLQAVIAPPLAVWAVGPLGPAAERRLGRALPVLALGLLAFAVLRWERAPLQIRPGPGGDPALVRLLAAKPGPVQWIGGDTQTWTYANRAFWASELQGASIVFSREQALTWEARMRRLLPLRLVSPKILRPWDAFDDSAALRPTRASLTALCRLPDGPAWVILPLTAGAPAPALADVRFWSPQRQTYERDGRYTWRKVARYAVIGCEAERLTPPSAATPPSPPPRG